MTPPVLLVCDHVGLRKELAAQLMSTGLVEVLECDSGDDALRQVLKRDVALVLMMLDMPGMDGIEVLTLMRANPKTRHIPTVLLSGHDGDAARAYAAGCSDFLRLPIDRAALKAKVGVFVAMQKLRLEIAAHQAQATPVQHQQRGADGLRLLLVDDRPENLIALDALLGKLDGVERVHASSGPECLRAVLRQDFAAILLDVQMPGMDGFQTAELLRANPKTSGIPIIFVTAGLGGREAQFKGYELGVVDYLIKPLEPAILVAKVKVFCDLYLQRIALERQAESLARLVADRDRALARSSENLADSRARYQRLLGAVTHQLFTVQRVDGQLQSYGHGDGCEAITGYPSTAFADDPWLWLAVIPEPDRSRIVSLANDALLKGESGQMEHRVRTSAGALRWVRSTFVQGATDGAAVCDVLMEDIDARKLAEDERARIGETLELATRAAGLGIWDWDLVANKLDWDDRMYALCGVERGQLGSAHETWLATTLKEDQVLCDVALQKTLQEGAPYDIELRVCWPDGTLRYLRADGKVQRDPNGKPLRMTGVHYDITERKQAEFDLLRHRDQLQELVDERTASLRAIIAEQKVTEAKLVAARGAAEAANQVKSEFLAKMSHELRTPLNAVIGFSRLAVKDEGLSGEQKDNMEIIHRSGQHLLTLINDVLQLSKIESGRMWLSETDVDLAGVLREVVEMLDIRARQSGLILELVMDAIPALVRVDAVKLRQVLINLLGNALKFTVKGIVRLEVRAEPTPQGVSVRFEVNDTGIGIAKEYYEAVFEPFFQMDNHATAAGTGLGLAISRQYVQMMGGEMTLVSSPGVGSTFGFTLHLALGAAGAADKRGAIEGLVQQHRGMGVLVADDDPISRKLLVALLEPLGFKLAIAVDGMDALAQLDQFTANLIVLDWRMPRLDGLETISRIRQRADCSGVPIVICSASAFEEQCNAALKAGANAYLRKPLIEDELFAVLEDLLGLSFVRAGALPESQAAGAPLAKEDLAGLPQAIRQSLRSGAVELDHAKLDRAIAQIRIEDEALAARIMAMTVANQLRQLWTLLDEST